MDDNEKIIKFKINLRNKILAIYYNKGYSFAVNTVKHLIKDSNKKTKEFHINALAMNLRGECCEILLELQIREFAKQRNLPWILSKGLTFQRRDHRKDKTTELDLTLFTPSRVFLFESKFRKGKIKLIDECKIIPDYGNVTDVYKQNMMHLDNLRYYLAPAILSMEKGKPFSIVLYVDEISRVTDAREAKYKSLIPLVGSENILEYLNKIANLKTKVWDIKKLARIVKDMDAVSDKLFEDHVKREASKGYGFKKD